MDLKEQVDCIREEIEASFDRKLKRLGLTETERRDPSVLDEEQTQERERIETVLDILLEEGQEYEEARNELIEEFSFTFFNRIAALKVMGLRELTPEPITRRPEHGGRSFAHNLWLEDHPEYRSEPREGIGDFLRSQFHKFRDRMYLFSDELTYADYPPEKDLLTIIERFNEIEEEKWQEDDILGWLYEYYNASKKQELKDSGEDIEWDKVSLSSQIYTPRWVVEFLVNNSLGKLWMEMHPDSEIAERHDIANIPDEQVRDEKPVEEITFMDPACGSGNFLLYAYELFYEMYEEEGRVPEENIPVKILENNLHGIDIDERAVQIAHLALDIKAMTDGLDDPVTDRNIVSTNFHLPELDEAKEMFEGVKFNMVSDVWEDLREARKFGSLIRVENKLHEAWEEFFGSEQQKIWQDDIDSDDSWESIRTELLNDLEQAIGEHSVTDDRRTKFFRSEGHEGIQFLQNLSKKYDIACANPPYTDSANYADELKSFVNGSFKEPDDFSRNLYTVFLKRNEELTSTDGKVGMLNPMTFMYIQKYEDVRKFILNNNHINLFVEFGLGGMFGRGRAMVDESIYILEKDDRENKPQSVFIDVEQYTRTPKEKHKRDFMEEALEAYVNNQEDEHLYQLNQEKMKVIDGWPFIYWISDNFREKFTDKSLAEVLKICQGVATTNNLRFLRYWWEISSEDISQDYTKDKKRWVPYSKGGPWNKWFGNLWLCVDWRDNGEIVKQTAVNKYDYVDNYQWVVKNEEYYFQEGITYSASGSKGITFRYLPKNHIFDVGGSCIFLDKNFDNIFYTLALLNSKISYYTADCLNPTVNTQVGDLKRVPFVHPEDEQEELVSSLSKINVDKKKELLEYDPLEKSFEQSAFESGSGAVNSVKQYFDDKNEKLAVTLLNEAVIDHVIFDVYDLTSEDKRDVLQKQGTPLGSYPVTSNTRDHFLRDNELPDEVQGFVQELDVLQASQSELDSTRRKVLESYESIDKNENALRFLSDEHEINPITIAQWIKESDVLPKRKVEEHAQKFILVCVREILMDDEDGLVPMIESAGEQTLQNRMETHLLEEKGFSQKDISQLEEFLGYDIEGYLMNHFFEDQCDILNLFMYQPKTPFIWHLSSGPERGFEVAIIIYKWKRDRLMTIRNKYLEKRRQSLKRQLNNLGSDETAEAQEKRETLRAQLHEIDEFEEKVEDLLNSGYDPDIDDGVGYNIAPLQKRDMLKSDPLTSSQLDKFLNEDWGSRASGDNDDA